MAGSTHFYDLDFLMKNYDVEVCQCPKSGSSHFYPTLLKPSIYAGCRPYFCTYFSEYSDK